MNQEFRLGRTSIEDEPRDGAPQTAATGDKINAVKNEILSNRRIKISQLSALLNLSVGTVETIIHQHLGMRKLCARWVPRNLSVFEKQIRTDSSEELLAFINQDPEGFERRLVTEDECWLFQFDPEMKRTSMEWRGVDSPPPKKSQKLKSVHKVLLTVFWDREGIIQTDYLREGNMINGNYYADQLRNLRENIKAKRRGLLSRGVLLLQDNARPHTCRIAMAAVEECKFELVQHPPYSPDLAPSDYHLFPNLKKSLKGTRFDSDAELIQATESWFESQPKNFFRKRNQSAGRPFEQMH